MVEVDEYIILGEITSINYHSEIFKNGKFNQSERKMSVGTRGRVEPNIL